MRRRSRAPLVLAPENLDRPFAEAYRTVRANIGFSAVEQPPLVLTPGNLDTPFAEAYRTLRANIGFTTVEQPDGTPTTSGTELGRRSRRRRRSRTLAVLSASRGEGKTTTAVNLGIIMAQAGRAVIVDADFRSPSMHKALASILPSGSSESLQGLSSVIGGAASVRDVLRPTAFAHLTFVPAGPIPPNPGDLLASPCMTAVLADLKDLADYVIFDSPSLLEYADGLLLGRMVDGVIYVLRAGTQNRTAQRRIKKQLQQANARLLGVVFNNVRFEEVDPSYGYYRRTEQVESVEGHMRSPSEDGSIEPVSKEWPSFRSATDHVSGPG